MKFNQIIVYLIVFILLFAAVSYMKKNKVSGYKIVSEKVDFSKITDVTADTISIKKGEDVVELKKENGKWTVKNKFSYKADEKSVENLINTVREIKMNDIVSKNPEKRHLFHLDTQGIELVIKDKDQRSLTDMIIGKPGPDWSSNYFCVKNNDHVYLSSKWLNSSVKTDAKDFLHKKLFDDIKKEDIQKLDISYETREISIIRTENGWEMIKPEKIEVKTEEVEKLCSSVVSLGVLDVVDNKIEKRYGFDTSEIKILFSDSNEKSHSIIIGAVEKNNQYYLKTDTDFVYLIAKHMVANLDPDINKLKKPIEKPVEQTDKKESSQDDPVVEIDTEKGTMKLELFEDDAPNTVANFISLIEKKYYDGLKFHRVIADFMAQGGCPYSKDSSKGTPGTGGPGYTIKCEINENKHLKGSLSMAHAGKDTGGSQFFICFQPQPHLDGKHTVFGKVVEGMDVLDKIAQGTVINEIRVIKKREHTYEPVIQKKE